MKFSTIFSILPVLALAAPALGSPVAKKRACTRPSASASASASAPASSVDASASASATASVSAIESASASASESATSSINTGIFAPEPTASASASLEPASSDAASASASTSEAASSTSSAEPAASSSASGDNDADLFVRLHNDFRAQYGAPAVEWDQELADYAKNYAPICQMQHSSGPYGENLAGGAGDGYDISRAFQSWADEGNHYDWNQPGVLEATVDGKQIGLGHFTQVVWKDTTKIGCAAVSCADGTLFTGYGESLYVVCEYAPAGNVYLSGGDVNSLFVENVGTKIA